MKRKRSKDDEAAFIAWARESARNLETADMMVGVWTDEQSAASRWRFTLQVGHCLMSDKPLVLIIPDHSKVPTALRRAATIVEYYTYGDRESCDTAVRRALKRLAAVEGLDAQAVM